MLSNMDVHFVFSHQCDGWRATCIDIAWQDFASKLARTRIESWRVIEPLVSARIGTRLPVCEFASWLGL